MPSKHLPYGSTAADVSALVTALLTAHRAGDAEAAQRIAAFGAGKGHPPGRTLSQADAEAVIAVEHGFASWRQLQAFVRHREGLTDFLQLACLCYFQTDNPANQQRAREMLAAEPSLATRDIWHAACVGNGEAVAAFLDEDRTLANGLGGHFDWPPLLYACYSRLNLPEHSTLAVAELLLQHGVDANAHYMWGGQYRFTALTGAYGEGEMGPVNQPPHEQRDALSELLLGAGADPNDSQALYNTMFTPGSECLRALLARGLSKRHRSNWRWEANSVYVENPDKTLDYQLRFAVRNHHPERAKLLLEHGANAAMDDGEGQTLHKAAMLGGHPDLAEHLAAHGAPAAKLNAVERFAAACMAADEDGARALLAQSADLVARTQAELPQLLPQAASANRLDAARLLLTLGFDPNRPLPTALHQAAFHGHAEMAELLLAHGAKLDLRDTHHNSTPAQWAKVGGNEELASRLTRAAS